MGVVKNNIFWTEKNEKLLLYFPFELRQTLLFEVHRDLLTGQTE
jgi:hypothetical protein